MKTVKKQFILSVLLLGGILSGVLITGCQKNTPSQPDNSVHPKAMEQARISMPGSDPGGLWYFGTPYPGGCTTPCGNFCHADPWDMTFNLNEGMQEAGPAYYSLTDDGKLVVEVDMTHVNPQHLNEIVASNSFNVPVPSELPYQAIVDAYNNAGITGNIPHYNMPAGPHNVTLHNSGVDTKLLTVTFTSPDAIEVNLEY